MNRSSTGRDRALAVLELSAQSAPPAELMGPLRVIDGDTIVLANTSTHVRPNGVDARAVVHPDVNHDDELRLRCRFPEFPRRRSVWYHSTVHRLFQDDLPSVGISRLRASGVVTSNTKSVEVVFGEGNDGLRRQVRVVHRRFPSGGE
jgi:hypothetical protein